LGFLLGAILGVLLALLAAAMMMMALMAIIMAIMAALMALGMLPIGRRKKRALGNLYEVYKKWVEKCTKASTLLTNTCM